MKKRWLKLAAIGIMTGTLVVQAPVAAYAEQNGEAVVMEAEDDEDEVGGIDPMGDISEHLKNDFNITQIGGIGYYSLKGKAYKDCITKVAFSDGCEYLFAFDKNGYLDTEWKQDKNGNWYYFDDVNYYGYRDGSYAVIRGNRTGSFYFDKNGILQINKWHQWEDDGAWSWFDANGKLVMNAWAKISGKWYHFDRNAIMQTGWQKISGKWYYMNGSGAMLTGWQKINGKWYYMNTSGAMLTGWNKIGGKWYYMNGSGAMLTGWNKIGGKWYYMNGSGVMVTGWLKLGSKWYYLNGSGVMVTGRQKIGGKWYQFNASGVWIK